MNVLCLADPALALPPMSPHRSQRGPIVADLISSTKRERKATTSLGAMRLSQMIINAIRRFSCA
jgi:hypothetical protein